MYVRQKRIMPVFTLFPHMTVSFFVSRGGSPVVTEANDVMSITLHIMRQTSRQTDGRHHGVVIIMMWWYTESFEWPSAKQTSATCPCHKRIVCDKMKSYVGLQVHVTVI